MNFLGKRKQRPRCEERGCFKGEVYLPSLRAGSDGMNFPFICIPLLSGRTQRRDYPDETTRNDPRSKYIDPRDRDTIRSNRLAHYDPVIHDRYDRPTVREWSESFLLQKRSENTIILVSAMRKRERCDCTCGSYDAMENTEICSLFCNRTYFCRKRRLIFRAASVNSRWYVRPVFSTRPCEDCLLIAETLFIMILIKSISGAHYSLLSVLIRHFVNYCYEYRITVYF